jgi:hypothetical protein
MSSPAAAMRWFAMITTIYFPIRYYTRSQLTLFIYLLLIFLGCYSINLALSESLCGSYQYSTAFVYTLFPWALIFGIMILVLQSFPGWLAPFSNTFGYLIAKLSGLTFLMQRIFKQTNNASSKALETLANIYNDPSIIINEVTPINFETFWNKMKESGLIKNIPNEAVEKQALFDMVLLKYTIAEYIWYMLTGLLSASVSYNYVVNAQCGISNKELSGS